jgi:hypothetical protein
MELTTMYSVLISTISFVFSLITLVIVFLLDKDYPELKHKQKSLQNNVPNDYMDGIFPITIEIELTTYKDTLYDFHIDKKSFENMTYNNKKCENGVIQCVERGNPIKLVISPTTEKKYVIGYRDSKGNVYEQILSVIPLEFDRGKMVRNWHSDLSGRKWKKIDSLKKKYWE